MHKKQTQQTGVNHMCRQLEKSIALSEQLDEKELDEDNDLFWALVKYAENVQECIIQLDNLNKTILPALDEVPIVQRQLLLPVPSIILAGSPPVPGSVFEPLRFDSWGRRIPG